MHGVVLIVEDDDALREVVAEALTASGYEVLAVTNGQEALDALDGSKPLPCVVLLDLMMPVMDGWTFLDTVQQRADLASLPVVVMSAAGNYARNTVPMSTPFIRKPFHVDALIALIAPYCERP